jgi:hypothetical protein
MEKPNRAERRRNKFGGGRATEHGGWPTVQPNPVFTGDAPDDGSAAAPEQPASADSKKAKPAKTDKPVPEADAAKD